VRNAIVALLVLCGPALAYAQQVVVVPPTVQPTVHVEPRVPVTFQDLTVGYRHEELPNDLSMNGFSLRATWRLPLIGIDAEGQMSGAWGYDGAQNLIGHSQISLGLRIVPKQSGAVRPFVVAVPVLDSTKVGSDWAYAVGANAGVGVDLLLPSPGLISVDVRGGQTWDLKAQEWSGWTVLATVSIGLHVEPGQN
jgi:hypothetical protein